MIRVMDSVIVGNNKFKAVFAITEEEQLRGLMWTKLPTVMAFPFKKSKPTKFWMKNTLIPLDVLFCNKGKIIECHYGVPLSEKLFGPDAPSDLVIEMPSGYIEKNNIKIGDEVDLQYSIKTMSKWYTCHTIQRCA